MNCEGSNACLLCIHRSPFIIHYLALISTAPCLGTSVVYRSRMVPRSFRAHRSRTPAERPSPIDVNLTEIDSGEPLRLKSPTALLPSANGFIQTSRGPSCQTRRAAGAERVLIDGDDLRIGKNLERFRGHLGEIVTGEQGAARRHHKVIWVRPSSLFSLPIPICRMSGSFQCPGLTNVSSPSCWKPNNDIRS